MQEVSSVHPAIYPAIMALCGQNVRIATVFATPCRDPQSDGPVCAHSRRTIPSGVTNVNKEVQQLVSRLEAQAAVVVDVVFATLAPLQALPWMLWKQASPELVRCS